MTPDNIIDRTHYGKGLACLACRRASNRRSKRKARELENDPSTALDSDLVDIDDDKAITPCPPGHTTIGWLLLDADGIAVESFKKLTDFTDAYSKKAVRAVDDLPVTRAYQGPPEGYRLTRITTPRHAA